jgi:DNA-binding beta-propeller fold protein YncE
MATGVVTTLAGTAGLSGSTDATGTAARFYYPFGITTDGTNLYVADGDNQTIRVID